MTRRHLIVFVLFATTYASASNPKLAAADALIQRAIAHSDWRAAGSLSVSGKVVLESIKGSPTVLYKLLWKSPREWGDSISAPGYGELRVGLGDKLVIKRSMPSTPGIFLEMYSALNPQRIWYGIPNRIATRVQSRTIAGKQATCVSYAENMGPNPADEVAEFCADPATSDLLYASGGVGDVDYSNFTTINGHAFPKKIKVVTDGHPAITIALSAKPAESPAPISAPAGAAVSVNCPAIDFREPVLLRQQRPYYPGGALMLREQGTSGYAVLITPEGRVQIESLTVSAGRLLDDATRSALEKWHYFPATCDGKPIGRETVVDVHFEIRDH